MNILDEIKNLDPNNPGIWPPPVKAAVFVITFIALLFAGWKLGITSQREELLSLEQQEGKQLEVLDVRQRKAARLNPLKEQMKEIEQSFGDMVRQLPNKTEVAGLLVDISQTGLSAGLEFKLFQPREEALEEFYTELPINISVVGDYHQFGEFVSGIAALPRIVTIHNIVIKSQGQEDADNGQQLVMSAVAKTYRALEEDEENSEG